MKTVSDYSEVSSRAGVFMFRALMTLLTALAIALTITELTYGQGGKRPRSFTSVRQMVVHGEYLIWLDDVSKSIYRIKLSDTEQRASTQVRPEQLTAPAELLWSGKGLDSPVGLAVDDKYIYITDKGARAIYQLSPDRHLREVFSGNPLRVPIGLAATDDGRLFVSDTDARRIFIIDISTGKIVGDSPFQSRSVPTKLRYEAGALLGMEFDSRMAFRFTIVGISTPQPAVTDTNQQAQLLNPLIRREEVDLASSLEHVLDFDTSNNVMYCLDSQRQVLFMFPLTGVAPALLRYSDFALDPIAIAINENHIYLADNASGSFVKVPRVLPTTIFFEGAEAPEQFVNFLSLLRGMELLPMRMRVLKAGETLESIVAESQLVSGKAQKQYSQFLCDLNTNLCEKKTYEEGQKILVPDFEVKRYYVKYPVTLPLEGSPSVSSNVGPVQGLTLEEVARRLLKEEVRRSELDKLLLQMNPTYEGLDIMSETKGYFLIPTPAYTVQGSVPQIVLIERANNPKSSLWSDTAISIPYTVKPQSIRGGRALAPTYPPRDFQLTDKENRKCTELSADFCRVLDLIKYQRPNNLRSADVGVIDLAFDPRHPAFLMEEGGSALTLYKRPGIPSGFKPSEEDSGGESNVRSAFVRSVDHGNHVSALIGGRHIKNRMQGIHPSALIYGINLADFKIAIEADEKSEVTGLRVFNLSIGEDKDAPPELAEQLSSIKAYILKNPSVLFVIAAGNDADPIPPESLASKGELDNVIVVGATETVGDSPSLMSDSNFGEPLVSVVAPGRDILSALAEKNESYGTTSGTSQSCALVAGTSALLSGLEPAWDPWKIKARIVATADMKNWADGNQSDKVLTGMLDIKRAVLDRSDVIVMPKGSKGSEFKGVIRESFLNSKSVEILTGDPNEPKITILYRNLLRVKHSEKDNTKYIIIFAQFEDIPVGRVKRTSRKLRRLIVDGSNIRGEHVFPLILNSDGPGGGKKVEYNLREVEDFINK